MCLRSINGAENLRPLRPQRSMLKAKKVCLIGVSLLSIFALFLLQTCLNGNLLLAHFYSKSMGLHHLPVQNIHFAHRRLGSTSIYIKGYVVKIWQIDLTRCLPK